MGTRYSVIPFLAVVDEKGGLGAAAQVMERQLNEMAAQGWEFVETARITTAVKPGCLAGLFGAKSTFLQSEFLVFRWPARTAPDGE